MLSHLLFGQDRIAHLPLTAHLVSSKLLREQYQREARQNSPQTNVIRSHTPLIYTTHLQYIIIIFLNLHCISPATWYNVEQNITLVKGLFFGGKMHRNGFSTNLQHYTQTATAKEMQSTTKYCTAQSFLMRLFIKELIQHPSPRPRLNNPYEICIVYFTTFNSLVRVWTSNEKSIRTILLSCATWCCFFNVLHIKHSE